MSDTTTTARTKKAKAETALAAPGRDLPPCRRDQMIDPSLCELMPGHQHPTSDLDELVDSLAIVGQLHPGQVLVLPDGRHWVVAGRRRWLACRQAGYLYRADLWLCDERGLERAEEFARQIRVMENDQRVDPSAYDIAVQLRRIRNERACGNYDELAAQVAMHPSRVKRYMAIFGGSDRLLEAAEKHRLPLAAIGELVRLERQFGEASARKYITKVVAGELSAVDLRKARTTVRRAARDATSNGAPATASKAWDRVRKQIRALAAADPVAAADQLAGLLEELRAAVAAPAATTSEGRSA